MQIAWDYYPRILNFMEVRSSGENKYSSCFFPPMVQCSYVQGVVLIGDGELEKRSVQYSTCTMYRVLCVQCAVLIDGVYCTLHSVQSVVLTCGGEVESKVCNI